MSDMIEVMIAGHPATKQLIGKLQEWDNSNPAHFVFIKGFFLHYQKHLLSIINRSTGKDFVFINNPGPALLHYANTIHKVQTKDLKFSQLKSLLEKYEFKNEVKVEGPEQYNIKGDVISFWPIEYKSPIRASFFGEELEEIVTYDTVTSKRVSELKEFAIGDITKVNEDDHEMIEVTLKENNTNLGSILIFSEEDLDRENGYEIKYDFVYPQIYYNRMDILEKDVQRYKNNGYKIHIVSKHTEKISDELKREVAIEDGNLESGFVSKSLNLVLLSSRELFGTIFLTKGKKSNQSDKFLRQLEGEIKVGDYLVHQDHGIGVYGGIVRENNVETQNPEEYILLRYSEGDELLIPFSQSGKLTKYINPDGRNPKITRLSKGLWKSLKARVKQSITLLAKDLIEHFARRELAEVPPMHTEDSDQYKSFVEKFPYDATEDQIVSINQVLKDLSESRPMNRLIVGDVGFGKTEVFLRAAFKVVENGFQVAILAPTTVLAAQHFSVIEERFKDFPFTVASLSRFSTARENNETVQKINEGRIDIVVGTHRILSKDVQFKKLGLLIIDEEQRFGVGQKERIKKLHTGVHNISLSATPIPRTLSMALSEIVDISIINTPPKGRKSINTIVEKFSWDDARKSIMNEIKRNGQIYFVHNEVRTIESFKKQLEEVVPEAKIVVAHGQMHPEKLDKVIRDFYHKEYDMLLTTTIIENGIDMPNVNTIIVNKAQNFGLSQLYQLRGRVGRSPEQAYAYMFYTHKSKDLEKEEHDSNEISAIGGPASGWKETEETIEKKAPPKADERLKAINELQELGSGFNIASRDLEIRGAGNLLGQQQHGNIANVGLGLYMQMLSEEIERLKTLKKDLV